jgi:arginine/serine-rich splicing factor 17
MDGVKMTSNMQQLRDTSELVEFFKPQCLYLKPIARVNITVTLPQLKNPGQAISNWDLMERIKKLCRPTEFDSIRVTKSTIEFVRFEADVDNKVELAKVSTMANISCADFGLSRSSKHWTMPASR